MKALSLKQPWAGMVIERIKTIETRKWKTSYRGDIIICSSLSIDKSMMDLVREKRPDLIDNPSLLARGQALGIVEMYLIVQMGIQHEESACCKVYPGAYAWFLGHIRKFRYPHQVKGQLGLFELDIHDTDFIKIKWIRKQQE